MKAHDPFEVLMLALDEVFLALGVQDYLGDPSVFGGEMMNPITRSYTWGSFPPELQAKLAEAYEAYSELVEMQEAEEEEFEDTGFDEEE